MKSFQKNKKSFCKFLRFLVKYIPCLNQPKPRTTAYRVFSYASVNTHRVWETPIKRIETPIKRIETPIKRGETLVSRVETSIECGKRPSSVWKHPSSVGKHTSSVGKRGGAPRRSLGVPKRSLGVPKRAGLSEREDAGRGGRFHLNFQFWVK